jgi:ankyrin repeat protein
MMAACVLALLGAAIFNISCANNKEENTLEFFRALEAGDTVRAQSLLKYIDLAAVSARGKLTPLHWAVLSGDGELAALITERILDGAQPALLDARDVHGFTPLMWAAGDGDLAALEALIAAGTDLNLQSPVGNTALHYAIASARPVAKLIARRLLEAGANTRITNYNGEDAYIFARSRARPDMMAIFAAAGEARDAQ